MIDGMEKSKNAEKLRLLIDFLRFDAKGGQGLGNVELAAADHLSSYFTKVLSDADRLDEIDAQELFDKLKVGEE
jgi:hypothetical protein